MSVLESLNVCYERFMDQRHDGEMSSLELHQIIAASTSLLESARELSQVRRVCPGKLWRGTFDPCKNSNKKTFVRNCRFSGLLICDGCGASLRRDIKRAQAEMKK